MKLIERYIFRRIFALTLSALLVATGILLTTQLLASVDMVTRSADAALSFAVLALTLVPTITLLVAPFALLIGTIRTLNTMNTDSELAVLEAAGRPPAITARPVAMLGLLLSLASLATAHSLEPWSNRRLQDTIAAASADLIRSAVQSGSFAKVKNGLFVQIGKELPGGEFGQIVIVDARDPVTEVIYYAKRGVLTESDGVTLFVLADGEVHRRNNADRTVSIISFATSALDFSQFLSQTGHRGHKAEELSTAYLMAPDPGDPLLVSRPDDVRREIHRRFSEWLFPLAFSLIAAYFVGTARSSRQEQPVQIALAGVTAVAVRAAGFFTVSGAGQSPVLALLTYAVPLVTIAVFGGLILGSRAMRIPSAVMEGAGSAGAGLISSLGGARRLVAGVRNGGGRRP